MKQRQQHEPLPEAPQLPDAVEPAQDLHSALKYLEAVHQLLNFAPVDLVPRRLTLPARWPQWVVDGLAESKA